MSDSMQRHELQHSRIPYHQILEFAQTHVHQVRDAIQPSHPLLSPSPPAYNHSSIRVFSNESVLRIRWPKYWSFSFSINPSNEYSGLIFFRIDQLDLLAVQGILKMQSHNQKQIFKTGKSLRGLCYIIKHSNICIVAIQQGKVLKIYLMKLWLKIS